MAEDKILKFLEEHERKDRTDYARIAKDISDLKQEVKQARKDIQLLQGQVQPMVNQDEHIKWLAQKVTTVMKVTLVIISIAAAAFGIYKGFIK